MCERTEHWRLHPAHVWRRVHPHPTPLKKKATIAPPHSRHGVFEDAYRVAEVGRIVLCGERERLDGLSHAYGVDRVRALLVIPRRRIRQEQPSTVKAQASTTCTLDVTGDPALLASPQRIQDISRVESIHPPRRWCLA